MNRPAFLQKTPRHGYLCTLLTILAFLLAFTRLTVLLSDMKSIEIAWVRMASAIYTGLLVALLAPFVGRIRLNFWLVGLCLVGVVTNIVNAPPEVYLSWLRLGFFAALLVLVSPMVTSANLAYFRAKAWKFTLNIFRIALIVNPLITPFIVTEDSGVYFCGQFDSLNSLAFVSAVIVIDAAYRLPTMKIRSRGAIYIITATLFAAGQLIFSVSRASLMGCAIALLPLLWHYRRKLWVWLSLTVVVGTVAGMFLFSPHFEKLLSNKKLEATADVIYGTRAELWQARILEFNESPLIGVGFGASRYYSENYDNVIPGEEPTESTEPGSSWLSLMSCTGIIGLLCFLGFMVKPLKFMLHMLFRGPSESARLSALLVFCMFNMFFEGWLLFAGSALCYFFWLLTDRILSDYKLVQQ